MIWLDLFFTGLALIGLWAIVGFCGDEKAWGAIPFISSITYSILISKVLVMAYGFPPQTYGNAALVAMGLSMFFIPLMTD